MPWLPNPKALAAALLISWCLLILFIWIAFKPGKSEVSGHLSSDSTFLREGGLIYLSRLPPCSEVKPLPSWLVVELISTSIRISSDTSERLWICTTGVGN